MALIGRAADDGVSADAAAGSTHITLGTEITIVARCAVCRRWIRAQPRGGLTNARNVAGIRRVTGHRIVAATGADGAGIAAGAEIAIVAGCAVRRGRTRAQPGGGIAHAGDVTRASGRTRDRT
jgi:hypothetical protein